MGWTGGINESNGSYFAQFCTFCRIQQSFHNSAKVAQFYTFCTRVHVLQNVVLFTLVRNALENILTGLFGNFSQYRGALLTILTFLSDPGVPGVQSMGPVLSH